jgi:hypothetical protein
MLDLRTDEAMFGIMEITDIDPPAIDTLFELSSA